MTDLRVAFLGSSDFAVPTLEALIASPYRPVVVVTQPDRPAGRGRALRPPPVKDVAARHGLPVLQPPRLREPEATAALVAYRPDLQIVAAYGQILRPDVLALPRHGTLNVHASLLPRWRGASPVAAAIRAGDRESGVSIMLVDAGEDTGPVLARRPTLIDDDETAGTLSDRLAHLGAALLLETIPRWLSAALTAEPQDDRLATRAPRLHKADGAIDWTHAADQIARQIRACTPWPGASTVLAGTPVQILQATPDPAAGGDAEPGTVVAVGDAIVVQTGAGVLHVRRLQKAGKRALSAAAFARGERALLHARLTPVLHA